MFIGFKNLRGLLDLEGFGQVRDSNSFELPILSRTKLFLPLRGVAASPAHKSRADPIHFPRAALFRQLDPFLDLLYRIIFSPISNHPTTQPPNHPTT
jgi:hypothetical protein